MSKKILLVEDEAVIAMSESQMLEEHGYEVVIACNGDDAVEAVDSDPDISLILMDIDLGGGIDGTVAAQIILKKRDIPVVFLSSHMEPEVVEKTEKITSYGYIVKNSNITVIDASIKMALRLYEAHMELKTQKTNLNTALTKYEQTAEELYEREGMLRNLMENSIDAVYLLDEEGRFLDINKTACEMTGYTREELLSMCIADIDPNYPAEGFYQFWKEKPKGTSILFESIYKHKNGKLIPVEINGIFFEINNKKYLFGVARDLTDRKQAEVRLRKSEAAVREKLESILEPDGDIGVLKLADIIDYEALQTMMNDFYKLSGVNGSIIDMSGEILVGFGWQDICTNFHRVHPDTLKNCLESDVILSRGVPAKAFKAYHCKNSMWDIVTPIIVDEKHLGNIFLGQFFFEDEVPDYQLFRKQARQYGFDETEYLAALDRVPRYSRETVDTAMAFYSRLAEMISSLSYTTIKLSRNIEQQKNAEEMLKIQNTELRVKDHALKNAIAGIALNNMQGEIFFINDAMSKMFGYENSEAIPGKTVFDAHPDFVLEKLHAILETLKAEGSCKSELKAKKKNGELFDVQLAASLVTDEAGNPLCVMASFEDITEKKQREMQLREQVQKLQTIEWMLSKKTTQQDEYIPGYGDLSELNKGGLILHSAGKEQLKDIASEYLDLLETSTAIYEKDGSYALGVFSSGWCRLMDSASRKLCDTGDNQEALESGKWLCHESCWNDAVLAMEKDRPVEVECNGGIRMYAVPIHANGEIVGAMNFGYGSPPTDEAELETLSHKYKIPVDELRRQAQSYNPRPQFMIDYSKERIQIAAIQLGRILSLKKNEEILSKKSTLLEESQELANLGSWEWNITNDKWDFSEQWKQIHGVSDVDLNTSRLLEIAHPEDVLYIEKALSEGKLEGKPYNIQHRIIRADNNETRYIHSLGKVEYSRDANFPVRMVGTAQDITDQKVAEDVLRQALEEKDYLMKELNHRVKNSLFMVSSLIRLKDSETKIDLSDIQHQVKAIGLIHEKLYKTGNETEICCREYFDDLLSSIFSSFSRQPVRIESDIGDIFIPAKSAMSLGLIINEIATNSIKHGFSGKQDAVFSIKMEKDEENNRYKLTITNNGKPFPEEIKIDNPDTLGLRLISALITQLGGTMVLQKKPQPVFTFRFPIEAEQTAESAY